MQSPDMVEWTIDRMQMQMQMQMEKREEEKSNEQISNNGSETLVNVDYVTCARRLLVQSSRTRRLDG